MIDNIELLLPFIQSEKDKNFDKDAFWYLQILQRKKENELLTSNSRVIKNYYIKSQEYLLDRYEEIKTLCNVFNARASLRLNKRSWEKVGFKAMINMANTMQNKEYQFLPKSYDRAVGYNHNDKNKKWIPDIDNISFMTNNKSTQKWFKELEDFITNIEPIGKKAIVALPTKNGTHVITEPFNLKSFKDVYPHIEVHKDNPTNLYIP